MKKIIFVKIFKKTIKKLRDREIKTEKLIILDFLLE